jgi:polysaccharide export outer membrane protein
MKFLSEKIVVFLIMVVLSSCSSKKDILYFSDIKQGDKDKLELQENKIQLNDILNVLITSSNPDLSIAYNTAIHSNASINGYLVGNDGTITLPVLGKVKVEGLSFSELENVLQSKLIEDKHLSNPIVMVRLLNAKFTVLGEVNAPGTYNFNEQNISLIQALGYAGDLTIHGKRKNILIIREENNVKSYATIDLTSKNWFNTPYYYIKPNDVIYVNPDSPKVKSAGFVGTISNLSAVISVVFSTLLTIIVLTK